MSKSLWPLRPKPLKGEILSSWVNRIAGGYHLELSEFRKKYLPKTPINIRDLDLMRLPAFFEDLARGIGISADEARKTGFAVDEGVTYTRKIHGYPEWVIPSGSAIKNFTGVPFCPSCLAEDPVPYYRKHWRYAFHPVCPKHGLLTRSCPSCKSPYFYLSKKPMDKVVTRADTIGHCQSCGIKFKPIEIGSGLNDQVLASVQAMQSRIVDGLESGWVKVPNRGMVHIYVCLKGLHYLAPFIQLQNRKKDVIAWISSQTEATVPDFINWGNYLESESPEIHAWILYILEWLICDWPHRMISLMKTFELRQIHLGLASNIFWLTDPYIEALMAHGILPTDEEFASAKALLAGKRGYPPTNIEVAEFMRTGIPPNRDSKREQRAQARLRWKADFQKDYYAATAKKIRKQPMSNKNDAPDLFVPFHAAHNRFQADADIEEASEDIAALKIELKSRPVISFSIAASDNKDNIKASSKKMGPEKMKEEIASIKGAQKTKKSK